MMDNRGTIDGDELYGKFEGQYKEEIYLDANDIDVTKKIHQNKYSGWTTLHRCAFQGLTDDIDLIVSEDYDINGLTENNETPLFLAVKNHHFDTAKKLLELGASPNIANAEGWTPLHIASHSGNHKIVSELLKANEIDVDATLKDGATSLHLASFRGHEQVVELLISAGCNVNLAKKNGSITALHLAAYADHKNVLSLLTIKGNVNCQDSKGFTPLHLACMRGNLESVQFLVHSANAKIDVIDRSGNKPVDLAEKNNHDNVVSFLNDVKNDVHSNWNFPKKAPVQVDENVKHNDSLYTTNIVPVQNEEPKKPSPCDHFLKCICCCFYREH